VTHAVELRARAPRRVETINAVLRTTTRALAIVAMPRWKSTTMLKRLKTTATLDPVTITFSIMLK
jgi:hypothetical protein